MTKFNRISTLILAGSLVFSSIGVGKSENIVLGKTINLASQAENLTTKTVSTTKSVNSFITGGVADSVQIPEADSDMTSIGATMPYTRYDSAAATLGGGAILIKSTNFSKTNIASQSSEQSYVSLPNSGSYVEWTMATTGNGVTMRFTMPDSPDGTGQNGLLDVYVNGVKVQTVNLTSYYMWQYFTTPNTSTNPTGSPSDKPVSGATPAFAFDEIHFLLSTSLKKGDKIRVQSTGGMEYGVDFLEIEETGAKIEQPANSYSVIDYGATPNDGKNDFYYIRNCINAAARDGKDVYIPEGTFELSKKLELTNISDIKITGAGIWYTNLVFTSSEKGGGGISGNNASNVEFCHMYINSKLNSRYNQEAAYKCFMDVWAGGSYIHDIWEEHFECGFWIADYNFSNGVDYSDGLVLANNRIRNNYADGVNFCQGTSNATVYNCSIRNNGDDGLAMWNNDYQMKDESGNTFCYNTIDFVWRAGGIAVYGGDGHQVYNNYISDMFMASGIHLNTTFSGYKFTNTSAINFANNIIIRSGTSSDSWNSEMAAVDLSGNVKNVIFDNTYIYDAQHDAVRIMNGTSGITFKNLYVYGAGANGQTTNGTNGALFKFASTSSSPMITVDGLTYCNVPYGNLIYGSRVNCDIINEKNLGTAIYTIPQGAGTGVITPIISGNNGNSSNTTGSNQNATNNGNTTSQNIVNQNTTNQNAVNNENAVNQNTTKNPAAKIKVAKTKIKKIVRTKNNKKAKITLKKVKGAAGYQIQYSTKKNFKKKYTKKVSSKKNVATIKKLNQKKKYYVRARAYRRVDGKNYFGKWTGKKIIK